MDVVDLPAPRVERLLVPRCVGLEPVVILARFPVHVGPHKNAVRGADVVVNAAGSASVLKQSIDIAARRGHVLYFAATLQPELTLDLDLIHYKELRLVGSYDSTIAQYGDALALIRAGVVQVKPLISHRLPLERVQEGFELARKQEGLKVQIVHQS